KTRLDDQRRMRGDEREPVLEVRSRPHRPELVVEDRPRPRRPRVEDHAVVSRGAERLVVALREEADVLPVLAREVLEVDGTVHAGSWGRAQSRTWTVSGSTRSARSSPSSR